MKSYTSKELIENYSIIDLEKLLPIIRKNGFDYKLIKRENRKCLYAQMDGGKIISYEIFKTKILKYRERMMEFKMRQNINCEPLEYREYKESFPGDEEFGKRAWTYKTKNEAEEAYNKL